MPNDTALNVAVKDWARDTEKALEQKFDELGIQHRANSPSARSAREVLAHRLGYGQGVVTRVGFKFPRHMVFVHKGVGKGVPVAMAGSSATPRKPKPWFNPVIDEKIEDLADSVAEHAGSDIVNRLNIR